MNTKTKIEILSVVPARGNSKSVYRKNIAPLAGKPLIQWTIEAAARSVFKPRIIVSTEDPEIAEIAEKAGAEVPFTRPEELSRDNTPGDAPLVHAVEWLQLHEGYSPDYLLYLQPTSPLRTSEDIDQAVRLALDNAADNVISVTPVKNHPYYTIKLDEKGKVANFLGYDLDEIDKQYPTRQSLPPAYCWNGSIYLSKTSAFMKTRSFSNPTPLALIIPESRAVDIDTPSDLRLAEILLTAQQDNIKKS